MLKIKRLTETVGLKVYIDNGELFGYVEEVNLVDNRIDGWRIVVSRESQHASVLGGARGIIVPHNFIKAIGDIVLISSNAIPVQRHEEDMPLDEGDLI
jgi:sporulation protein YlmC with PRC-barrel domain